MTLARATFRAARSRPSGGAPVRLGAAARLGAAVAGAVLLGLSGCGRYADFTLPLQPGPGGEVVWAWEVHDEPVIRRGAAGEWDGVDVLNPSVVFHQGRYWNLYSGFDGKRWHSGLATSADGLRWNKEGKRLSPGALRWEGDYIAANGSLMATGDGFLYWYQAGDPPSIGLARSAAARDWERHPQPVLRPGPRGSWDEKGVADPYVITAGGWFYMYYLGQDRARRQRIGVARSRDGIAWEKLRGNPVLELGQAASFDENGLGEPAVWSGQGWYWMLYTGRDRREYRSMGLARSRDGVRWERVSEQAVFRGDRDWNSKVVCDASVLPGADGLRVWYGGGDKAEPAENLNGQTGYAVLRLSVRAGSD